MNVCSKRVRMSLAIDGAWFLIRLRISTVYSVTFGRVFHKDAVVKKQKQKENISHEDRIFVGPSAKFQVIILSGGAAMASKQGDAKAKHYAAPSPLVAVAINPP